MPVLLYCVTQPGPAVSVATGVCDAAVESREMLGVRVYWSNVDDPEACLGQPDAMKQAALQFHQVLREILAVTTPIPFRFPTLLESGDAVEQQLASEQEMYGEALARVQNAVQYEITASWADEQEADRATPVSGREYLKRRQQAAGRVAAVEQKLKTVTAEAVREWRGRQERKTYRWFALVPRECRERFIAALRSAGPSEGVRLRLSGPWPPSEFVALREASVDRPKQLTPKEVEETVAELRRQLQSSTQAPLERIDCNQESIEQGLAKLVLGLIELLRQLLERQAIRRMEGGSLDDQQVEEMGLALMKLEEKIKELAQQFGLKPEDLNLALGPLGNLLE